MYWLLKIFYLLMDNEIISINPDEIYILLIDKSINKNYIILLLQVFLGMFLKTPYKVLKKSLERALAPIAAFVSTNVDSMPSIVCNSSPVPYVL
jgi:hypothetical protein